MGLDAHRGVEVGQRGPFALGVAGFPFFENADGQAAEHAQHPHGSGGANAAKVLVGRGIEALMEPRFNAPILTLGREPLRRAQLVHRPTGQNPDRLRPMLPELAVQLPRLGRRREADLFRRHRTGLQQA